MAQEGGKGIWLLIIKWTNARQLVASPIFIPLSFLLKEPQFCLRQQCIKIKVLYLLQQSLLQLEGSNLQFSQLRYIIKCFWKYFTSWYGCCPSFFFARPFFFFFFSQTWIWHLELEQAILWQWGNKHRKKLRNTEELSWATHMKNKQTNRQTKHN